MSSTGARRAWLAMASLAMLWSLALTITGGFAIETSWRLVSSRNAVRPLLAGLALVACYLVIWRRHWRQDLGPFAKPAIWPPLIAAISTAVALVVGFGWGTRIGAGPDQSGYVSQAASFARGKLTMPAPPWSNDAPWDDAAYTASPIGWRPTPQTHILAPTYSSGLPFMMALFEVVGGSEAAFYVVPLLGGLMVWSAYLLGARLEGPWAGAVAAVLTVSSPIFLFMQQQAMSDIPVSAFLTASLAASVCGANPWLAGIAAGGAVLTRPNLVPLVGVPMALLLLRRENTLRGLVAFAIPVGMAAVTVGALNWRFHGSPLLSGYGPLADFYSWSHIEPNVFQYGRWFRRTQTLVPLVGSLAVFASKGDVTERWRLLLVTVVIPLAMLAVYMPYSVFFPNDWGYLRFLLPGYPALFAGVGVVVTALVRRARVHGLAAVATGVVVGALVVHGWTLAVTEGIFMQRIGDARFGLAVAYAKQLPERSVLLSNAHSGTLSFYTGRDILRFEAIPAREIDIALEHIRRHGYAVFVIGDEFEIAEFRTKFAGTRTGASMSRKPRAAFSGVEVYDLPPSNAVH